jgi:hypothetical protein
VICDITRGAKMTVKEKERKEYKIEIKKMAEFSKKEVSKKEAISFLKDAGICTASVKLTKYYR